MKRPLPKKWRLNQYLDFSENPTEVSFFMEDFSELPNRIEGSSGSLREKLGDYFPEQLLLDKRQKSALRS